MFDNVTLKERLEDKEYVFLRDMNLLPLEIQGNAYCIDIKGDALYPDLLKAVLNGMEIDTSDSFDVEGNQNVYDI